MRLGRPGGAVRHGDFKLIEFYDDSSVELYNLRRDIGETRNLSRILPSKAAELRRMLTVWRKEVGAAMPSPNPEFRQAGEEGK
jgi:hypothetical protein